MEETLANMKVLSINGSPHTNGNTSRALHEAENELTAAGIEVIRVNIGQKPVQGCIGCYKCVELGRCVFHDDLYEQVYTHLDQIDGLLLGTPVYYAGANGTLCALLDRLFYSAGRKLAYKPGAAIAVARRGGAVEAFERLNKYFTIVNMPVVASQYWNIAYGRNPGETERDGEGMQTMRTLGRNMAWLMTQTHGTRPDAAPEPPIRTNFIR